MTTSLLNLPSPRWRQVLISVPLLWLVTACSIHPGKHESANATLWSLTAAEFSATARQAYNSAGRSLDLALEDPTWTAALEQQGDFEDLPPAVMMDIDQTVLDNSIYNARIVTQHGEYTQETFSAWCKEEAATAIPGSREFVNYAADQGVQVIYYSRRIEPLRECTTNNLEALGFRVDQEFLLLNDKQPETKKDYLRNELSLRYRILLLVGDDLEDFVAGSRSTSASRMTLVKENADRWGREWIVLPNPMYGAWEASLYGHDYGLSREERLNMKLHQLDR